jgi:hypothetical protein
MEVNSNFSSGEDSDDDATVENNVTDSEDLIENNFLKKHNLVINEKYHLLICKTCKYVIQKENVLGHLSNFHRSIIDSKLFQLESKEDIINELNNINPFLNDNFNISTEDAIPGLNIYKGFQCKNSNCGFLCRNKGSMLRHSKEFHSGMMDYEECHLQTLFLQPEKRRYFRVKKSSNFSKEDEKMEQELDQIFGLGSHTSIGRTGHQFVSTFHNEANWSTIVDKFEGEQLKEFSKVEVPPGMKTALDWVFDKGEKFAKVTNHFFSELIENPFSK